MEIARDYDFVMPGKIAWTSVNRFKRNTPSVGLLAVPLPAAAVLDDVAGFLEYERGWRIVSRTDESVRLRRVWRRRDDLNVALFFALLFIGVCPAFIYLLGNIPAKPATGDLLFSIVQSDEEETILECVARPYGRVQRSI